MDSDYMLDVNSPFLNSPILVFHDMGTLSDGLQCNNKITTVFCIFKKNRKSYQSKPKISVELPAKPPTAQTRDFKCRTSAHTYTHMHTHLVFHCVTLS